MSNVNKLKLNKYIDQVYHEPYHLLWNNCYVKSLRIFREAKKLGVEAKLIICFAKNPRWWGVLTMIVPHLYVLVNGEKVDVALSPEQEEKFWKNSDLKIYFPKTLCSLRKNRGNRQNRGL